jgi:hypothetical protein
MSTNIYENAPRYTAKEIEDGLYSGMDPDVELVAAQYYDAIRAELARVKAESLRVVVVPDEGNLYDWYMTPTGLGYPGKDGKQNNCIESAEGYYRLDECKPVRLERWEDE